MESVFVSYSHWDAEFVDRLVRDLRYSDVPATYDKWLLKVGDSIIDRIAEAVTSAASVVAILSKNSVKSEWVRRELSLAMTKEIKGRTVKVLPAVIDDCDIPASISDKLFADFRGQYYWGLTKLLEVLDPRDLESQWKSKYRRQDYSPQLEHDLENVLAAGSLEQMRTWMRINSPVLLLLFGHRWAFCKAIHDFGFGNAREFIDYLMVSGQSFRFEFQAVSLGPPNWLSSAANEVHTLANGVSRFVTNCRSNFDEFCRAASIRFSMDQIGPPSFIGYPQDLAERHELKGTLLIGRRHEYHDEQEKVRHHIYKSTDGLVEIASYDRLLDSIRQRERYEKP